MLQSNLAGNKRVPNQCSLVKHKFYGVLKMIAVREANDVYNKYILHMLPYNCTIGHLMPTFSQKVFLAELL